MSDGLSTANRMAEHASQVIESAEDLADALIDVRDDAFEYSALTLDVVNDSLRRAGVQIVLVRR